MLESKQNTKILLVGPNIDIITFMAKIDSRQKWTLAIFFTAMALRLIYFWQIKSNYPGWDTPTIDPLFHDLWAKQIAGGNILGSGPFFRAPFYAYFLGLIYTLFDSSIIAAKIIQHIIGATSCSLIFSFADKYFGRRVAIISSLVSAFSWVFVYFEDELLLDSLLVPISLILVWLLIRASEKPDFRKFLISGLVLGLAAITRPNYLALLPIILIWMLSIFPRDYRRLFSLFLAVSAGCAIMILPVTLRNIIIGHDTVLIASQGGINFYIGNNPYANGSSALVPEFGPTWQYADCEYLAKAESDRLGREMKPSEVSSFYFTRGLRFILHNPAASLRLMIKKFVLFWNSYEISNNQNLYFFRSFAPVTALLPPMMFAVSPLSILGLWFLFKMGPKYKIILYFVFAYMLTVILFFVNSRFRLPVLPFLIILAALAVVRLADYIKNRQKKPLAFAAIALLPLFALTNIDIYRVSHDNYAMSHFSLGNVYLKKRLTDMALKEYDTATKMAPCVPSAHLNRGIIYFGRMDFPNARKEFEMELETCGNSAQAHNNLSVLDRLGKNSLGALKHSSLALEQSPQYLEAYVNQILALRMTGADDSAYAVADYLTRLFPDYLPAWYFKGKILGDNGRDDLAEPEYKTIIARDPVNIIEKYDLSTIYSAQTDYGYKPDKMPGLAFYELGLIAVRQGKIDSALELFLKSSKILPDYPDAWTNLALACDHNRMYGDALAAFRKSLELDPDNPLTYYNLGLTLGKTGMIREAADVFSIALELKPDFKEAADKLKTTRSLLNSPSNQ